MASEAIKKINAKIAMLKILMKARQNMAKKIESTSPKSAARERQRAATIAFAIAHLEELKRELEQEV